MGKNNLYLNLITNGRLITCCLYDHTYHRCLHRLLQTKANVSLPLFVLPPMPIPQRVLQSSESPPKRSERLLSQYPSIQLQLFEQHKFKIPKFKL